MIGDLITRSRIGGSKQQRALIREYRLTFS
jgi:hypothetical protein